jgi:hypothetical protein
VNASWQGIAWKGAYEFGVLLAHLVERLRATDKPEVPDLSITA